ncbi:peptidoglycan-associated lipoprotein Pal [Pikeienuella sp. HZG-20]|uniref:peptidoglycan-associated lipoprotein Pal n=1 Tax=Paludibacillus litoralis TaxID=3133267 RepID=UPI0030EB7141
MNKLTLTIAMGAALMLAACSDEPPTAAAPGGSPTSGSSLDPSSTAYFQQTVGDRVFFETDSSRITPVGQQTLARQAEWLAENPTVNVVIEGHADERGTREYNLALGARRADAARVYLVSQGVSASRIRTISYGKERPEALCSAESCWSENRRAVSVITGAPMS